MTTSITSSNQAIAVLSRLVFAQARPKVPATLTREQFEELASLAGSHHVLIRALSRYRDLMAGAHDSERYQWADTALKQEQARIDHALSALSRVCAALQGRGCNVIVIKSLDHLPDLGSDLDLYSDADPEKVIRIMSDCFHAELAPRSWGDRLANKWNFMIPGLPELVEIHMGRIGQTGELISFAKALVTRSRLLQVEERTFRVTAPEDRLMICTLQRMYRHFYARLCDVVDTLQLLEKGDVDFDDLQASAEENGIWEGVATLLTIVSDYVLAYRGRGILLPSEVRSSARFGGDAVSFGKGFLRIPILPHSARLYASEWTNLMLSGQILSTARLTLLPCLATAAALGQKITGSDKGIW